MNKGTNEMLIKLYREMQAVQVEKKISAAFDLMRLAIQGLSFTFFFHL